MRSRRRTHHSHVAWSGSDEEFQSQTPQPAWDAAWDRVRAERKQAGLPNTYVPEPVSLCLHATYAETQTNNLGVSLDAVSSVGNWYGKKTSDA